MFGINSWIFHGFLVGWPDMMIRGEKTERRELHITSKMLTSSDLALLNNLDGN